jgi:hypothetical protein
MNKLTVILFVLIFAFHGLPTCLAGDTSQPQTTENSTPILEGLYSDLLEICEQYPAFLAVSIDFYDESKSQDFEIEFYRKSKEMHKYGAIDFLLDKRKQTNIRSVIKCIDNILNTWPG